MPDEDEDIVEREGLLNEVASEVLQHRAVRRCGGIEAWNREKPRILGKTEFRKFAEEKTINDGQSHQPSLQVSATRNLTA